MGSSTRAAASSPQTSSRPLRAWQQAALESYEQQSPKDFLVTATPGAGKTTFALTLAARLLQRREVARIVVVAPTDHLRLQWAEAADLMGIVLDPNLTNAVGPVRAGTQGYVTTYAQVAGKPMLHAARATAVKTLVILDEVHHAGDGLSWGEAVEEAFGFAARRLCLTGTPFRTKADERIPFVRYEEDSFEGDDGEGGIGLVSRADYTYGYKEALADSVVRPVVFAAYTGTSRWRNSAGEVVAASLSEAGTRSVEMQAWRTALDPKGQWVPHVIAAMDDRISHLRENGMPDAAGLILASDQDDARAYAKIVRRVTGKAPELILSDDPKASKKIERFSVGSARIAVCVRMISEGVDVPRAAVLAWMTSYRTPLFFAQAVGRVVRARASHESATVFLPAVRPLLALAAAMEEQRNHVMPPPKTEQGDELDLEPLPPKEKDPDGLTQWRRSRPTPGSRTSCTAGRRTPARARARSSSSPRTRSSSASPACSHPPRPPSCSRSGTTSCGCASRSPTGPRTAASSCSSRTTPTRTTPAGRGATPRSSAGRSTAWCHGWPLAARSPTR
ncbi:DEAD/DEAH box helicase [Blastococcus sp. PRF04-17]|uniref:DEAD/DEAH box helicase n=1 Tax=Blastococcus sp. PRF04-17 TaxID=2933797 RepID=UPI001FF68A95|nr:DEAD/DEAH box helicase family protein [Blastococcus sp. PRF04-17]UOX99859.1 DEAD/DEAH box helicase family protein [Blastococcus sp. PRF04-17]